MQCGCMGELLNSVSSVSSCSNPFAPLSADPSQRAKHQTDKTGMAEVFGRAQDRSKRMVVVERFEPRHWSILDGRPAEQKDFCVVWNKLVGSGIQARFEWSDAVDQWMLSSRGVEDDLNRLVLAVARVINCVGRDVDIRPAAGYVEALPEEDHAIDVGHVFQPGIDRSKLHAMILYIAVSFDSPPERCQRGTGVGVLCLGHQGRVQGHGERVVWRKVLDSIVRTQFDPTVRDADRPVGGMHEQLATYRG